MSGTVQAFGNVITATIANNAQDSSVIDMRAYAQGGFVLPAAFTGASVSFKVSVDDSTYVAFYDSANSLVSVTVTQGQAYAFPIGLFAFPYVKIRSASAEGGARSIGVARKY